MLLKYEIILMDNFYITGNSVRSDKNEQLIFS